MGVEGDGGLQPISHLPTLLGQYVQKHMTVIQKQPIAGRPSWKAEQYQLVSIRDAQF